MTTPAKIKLGAQPASFTRAVTFPMLYSTTGSIDCQFKYRTRSQFGALVDEMATDAKTDVADITQVGSMERYMHLGSAANARYLLKILDGWGLDQPLTHALACHLHEPQRGDLGDLVARAVAAQALHQAAQHEVTVRLEHHVDEVDDNDAADVA